MGMKIRLPLFGRGKKPINFEDDVANVITEDTKFNIKEAYKTTRTNMIFALNSEKSCNRIILTSSIPGEGKSLTSLNVAITFAMAENKVLIIDCDLRKPKLHKYLGENNKKGLSNYLGGFDKLEDCIKTDKERNVDYITAGHTPPNPIELFDTRIKTEDDLVTKFDLPILGVIPDMDSNVNKGGKK